MTTLVSLDIAKCFLGGHDHPPQLRIIGAENNVPQAMAGFTPHSTNSPHHYGVQLDMECPCLDDSDNDGDDGISDGAPTEPHAQDLLSPLLPPEGPKGPADFHHPASPQVYLPVRLMLTVVLTVREAVSATTYPAEGWALLPLLCR